MLEQVRGFLWSAAAFQVRRCRNHDDAAWGRKSDVNHVAVDGLDKADTRIEPFGHGVHQSVFDAHIELHLRVTLDEPRQQTSEHERHRDGGHCEPDSSRHFAAPGLDVLQRLECLVHSGARVLEKPLARVRERHASRGPHKQGDAEARLKLADGLAQGGSRNAEVLGGGRVATTARNGDERVKGVERREGHREDFLHSIVRERHVSRRFEWPAVSEAEPR